MGSFTIFMDADTGSPHIIITTPFVIRIMLPALRSFEPEYYEQAKMLGLSPIKAWWHGKISVLRAPIVVSAALTMAFSLVNLVLHGYWLIRFVG